MYSGIDTLLSCECTEYSVVSLILLLLRTCMLFSANVGLLRYLLTILIQGDLNNWAVKDTKNAAQIYSQ